jgi:hypothetical protein
MTGPLGTAIARDGRTSSIRSDRPVRRSSIADKFGVVGSQTLSRLRRWSRLPFSGFILFALRLRSRRLDFRSWLRSRHWRWLWRSYFSRGRFHFRSWLRSRHWRWLRRSYFSRGCFHFRSWLRSHQIRRLMKRGRRRLRCRYVCGAGMRGRERSRLRLLLWRRRRNHPRRSGHVGTFAGRYAPRFGCRSRRRLEFRSRR